MTVLWQLFDLFAVLNDTSSSLIAIISLLALLALFSPSRNGKKEESWFKVLTCNFCYVESSPLCRRSAEKQGACRYGASAFRNSPSPASDENKRSSKSARADGQHRWNRASRTGNERIDIYFNATHFSPRNFACFSFHMLINLFIFFSFWNKKWTLVRNCRHSFATGGRHLLKNELKVELQLPCFNQWKYDVRAFVESEGLMNSGPESRWRWCSQIDILEVEGRFYGESSAQLVCELRSVSRNHEFAPAII